MSKKTFFVFLWVCMVFVAAGCAQHQIEDPTLHADLRILHVNDMHSYVAGFDANGNACFDDRQCAGGLARVSQAIKDAKEKSDTVLALDAGDMFTGTLFFTVHKWKMLADLNSILPLDASTLGNHEWDEGCAELAKYLAKKRPFPILAANLTPLKGSPLAGSNLPAYAIFERGGHKVGVIGIANDEVDSFAKACPKIKFSERVQTVQKYVAELEKQGINRIILLTHIGLSEDRKLAKAVSGVDVIVGGHSHSYLGPHSSEGPYPIAEKSPRGETVLIVTAKRATKYIGELACNFDEAGVITWYKGSARELLPTDPRDPGISEKIIGYAEALSQYTNKIIGSLINTNYPDGMDECRQQECVTGMLMTDAMLDFGRRYGATIALLNSGGVRSAIPSGIVSQGNILSAFPFGTKILVRTYSGKVLLQALEHGVRENHANGPYMLQASGLRYVVDTSKEPGHRVVSVETENANGEYSPLSLTKQYTVVLPEYIAHGGDFFAMLQNGRRVASPEPVDADLLASYISRNKQIEQPKPGRLVRK